LREATKVSNVARNYNEIMRATAAHFNISPDALLGRSTVRYIVVARHVAWYIERQRGLSFPQIGALYKRDHSAIQAAMNHMNERVAVHDKRYEPAIAAIEEVLLHRAAARQKNAIAAVALACPTCGTDIVSLRRQLDLIQRRLDELGAKS
jgi:hypothetical protein